MKKLKNISFKNDTSHLFQPFGLAITTRGGSLGSTYGEDGTDWFRCIDITIGPFNRTLRITWKENE